MGKKIVSVILVVLLVLSDRCFYGFNMPAEAYDLADMAINGAGYWDGDQGMRFSLVNKEGVVERTVDLFDFEVSVETNQPPLGKVRGTIENIFTGSETVCYCKNESDYSPNYIDNIPIKYRVYNKCKTQIVKDENYKVDEPEITDEMVVAFEDSIDTLRKSEPWYVSDFRNVLKHSSYFRSLGYNEFARLISNRMEEGATSVDNNNVDLFICQTMIGNDRYGRTDFQRTDDAIYSMCDILYALGLDIYDNIDATKTVFNKNDKNILLKNFKREFLDTEYYVVVEPITFSVIIIASKDGDGNYYDKYGALYYGSATELGMLEASEHVYIEDDGEAKGNRYTHRSIFESTLFSGKNYKSEDRYGIRLGVWTRNLYHHCLYVTEQFQSYLDRISGENKLIALSGSNDIDELDKNYETKVYIWKEPDPNIKRPRFSVDFLKTYATAMALITPEDFIRAYAETFDYNYDTDTDVVTSVKIRNGSVTDFISHDIGDDLIKNENNVPYALLCKFTAVAVKGEGDVNAAGAFVADGSQLTEEFKKKAAELGFETDSSGSPIYEFYGAIDGISAVDDTGADRSCYLSFNWRTPVKPCTITFEAEFLGPDGMPEAIRGTSAENASVSNPSNLGYQNPGPTRETKIETGSLYNTPAPTTESARSITYFTCTVSDAKNKLFFDESAVPPDSVALISQKPAANASFEEKELYEKNEKIYNDYPNKNVALNYTGAYTPTVFSDREPVESEVSWTEYKASYGEDGEIELTGITHKIKPALKQEGDLTADGNTDKVFRADQNGLFRDFPEELASGYGTGVEFVSVVGDGQTETVTVNGREYVNELVTNFSSGAVLFPEYGYKTYYGRLIPFSLGDEAGDADRKYMLTANKNSVYYGEPDEDPAAGASIREKADAARGSEAERSDKSRVHFTPVWYPDGEYEIAVYMFGCWTPAGEIWIRNTYSIGINDSIYRTWYVTRTENNQRRN